MRIRIKNSDTFVNLIGYQGSVENHPILTDFADIYELTSDEPTSSSSWFDCTYLGDPRNLPDYYITREIVGKSLVNEVSNKLLSDYKHGKLLISEVMSIEESLKEVIYALRGGQFITSNYKLIFAQGVPSDLMTELTTRINELIDIHYA